MEKQFMKSRMILIFLMLVAVIVTYSSCYYDKASIVYPNDGKCDTTNMQLSTDLNSIMEAHCFQLPQQFKCSRIWRYYNLEDYTTIKNAATSGRLMSSINQDGNLAEPMPQSGAKLSDCNISKFDAWVKSGAPDN
jgi:hypothetical protein